MKSMRYQPGTFLEVDDLSGGRKVVLVGKDGVTFWDCVTAEDVTPLVIHPVMKPAELGTLVHFVASKRLGGAAQRMLEVLRTTADGRQTDCLFVMRTLWRLAPLATADDWIPADAQLQDAFQKATEQESLALRLHAHAQQYIAGTTS